MKLSFASISFALLATGVNGQCPKPSAPGQCQSANAPVLCGTNFDCPYPNDCEANLAGFVPNQCRPMTAQGCPIPGTGSSTGSNCPASEELVNCGINNCVYANECIANSVGFIAGCTAFPDGETANPIEPIPENPIEGPPGYTCPVPGTGSSTGTACPSTEEPVRCGPMNVCVYSNECIAKNLGFIVGCVPVPAGEPVNPIEPAPENPIEPPKDNLPTSENPQPLKGDDGKSSGYSSSMMGSLALIFGFSALFLA